MDLSIVAAIGSFLVSERLLPPKSLLIAVFSALFMYDLIIYSHDHASLRIYRGIVGPGLLAFTFLCSAFSLRIWRRNGIACDELLFLPGTIHEEIFTNQQQPSNQNEKEMIFISVDRGKENEEVHELNESNEKEEEMEPLFDIEYLGGSSSSGDSLENDNQSFSSAVTDESNYAYSPSGPSVYGASLDLFFPVLFNFHLFTEATRMAKTNDEKTMASILPLIFLSVLYCRAIIPPMSRFRFWKTICFTMLAPLHKVSFRDEIIGEMISSFVRPAQDFVFGFFYFYVVARTCLDDSYELEQTEYYLDTNRKLHCIVFPVMAVAPLIWRFLQCLRCVLDSGSRWPHLMHAIKFASAAIIVLHSLSHPLHQRRGWWFLAFIIATIHQIYCDVFIDWELFVFKPPKRAQDEFSSLVSDTYSISSISPSTYCIPSLYRFILQPFYQMRWNVSLLIQGMELRPQRLIKLEYLYWIAFWFNVIFRCCWMMNYLPSHYINADGDIVRTFSRDFNGYMGMFIATMEIARRCLWILLRVELESLKLTDMSYNSPNEIFLWLVRPLFGSLQRKFGGFRFSKDIVGNMEAADGEDTELDDFDQNALIASQQKGSLRKPLLFCVEMACWITTFIYLSCLAVRN